MENADIPQELRDGLRAAWQRYIDMTVPLRPVLHGYCRRLTRDLWDAEDLVQDTLMRGFAKLGCLTHDVENPRAYLLRLATNAWIDAVRRREREAEMRTLEMKDRAAQPPTGELHDAGAKLFELAPQERAAVILKDVYELRLEEIADVLGTTSGAIKSALHRGRERLTDPEAPPVATRRGPSPELLDRFVAAYNTSDVSALLALVLDSASVENVGCGMEVGREGAPRDFMFFHKMVGGHEEWPKELQYDSARAERIVYEGEPVVVWWVTRKGEEALEQVFRFVEREGKISSLRAYAFCPETMRVFAEGVGARVRTGLYRFPTPAPGEYY